MHPEDRAQGQQRIRREWLAPWGGPRSAILSDAALVDGRTLEVGRDFLDKAFAERPLGALTKELIGLADAGGDPGIERVLRAVCAHLGAVGRNAFQAQRRQPMHPIDDFQATGAVSEAQAIERQIEQRRLSAPNRGPKGRDERRIHGPGRFLADRREVDRQRLRRTVSGSHRRH
jgi:hypothetical protein